jgi:hypothetical protein
MQFFALVKVLRDSLLAVVVLSETLVVLTIISQELILTDFKAIYYLEDAK